MRSRLSHRDWLATTAGVQILPSLVDQNTLNTERMFSKQQYSRLPVAGAPLHINTDNPRGV
jgi:hypothetical protein